MNILHNTPAMDEAKQHWLRVQDLGGNPDILDCDPLTHRVLYKMEGSEPIWRQVAEVWTRVMGYHRPSTSFNIGKKGEFSERTYFKESGCGMEM